MHARIIRGIVAATSGAVVLAGMAGISPAAAADSTSPTPAQALRASSLKYWYLAPSLAALRSEVNRRWPGRDRSSDGWVGDLRHQGSTNSHNPVGFTTGPSVGTRGAVHALDITARGIDVDAVLKAVIGDSRVWYVIYDGRIWSRTYGWAANAHPGSPHSTHIHINLREDSQAAATRAEKDTSRWLGSSGSVRPVSRGTSTRTTSPSVKNLSTADTKALQRALIRRGYRIPSGPTGWYGPETTAAVKAFQRAQGWSGSAADGIVGPETLRRLRVTGGAASTRVTTPSTKSSSSSKSSSSKSSSGSLSAYRPGTASREVYFMQEALIKRGYSIPAGPTGYYGTKTVAAVKAFQRAQGWSASACDGIPGRTTLRLLGL